MFAADFGRIDCQNNPTCRGDINEDGDVDEDDLAGFSKEFGRLMIVVNSISAKTICLWGMDEDLAPYIYDFVSVAPDNQGYLGGYGSYTAGSPARSSIAPFSYTGNRSLYIDGGDTVLVQDSNELDITKGTIEAWIRLSSTPYAYDQIICKSGAYQIMFDSLGRIEVLFNIGGTNYIAKWLTHLRCINGII